VVQPLFANQGDIVMAKYAEIESVEVPLSAAPGSTVQITAKVRNTYSTPIGIRITGYITGVGGFSTTIYQQYSSGENIDAFITKSFLESFIMPTVAVEIHTFTWWYGADNQWHYDDYLMKTIPLSGTPTGAISIQSFSYPISATQGDSVQLTVNVKNDFSTTKTIKVVGSYSYNGSSYDIDYSGGSYSIPAGITRQFVKQIIMPNKPILLALSTYYQDINNNLVLSQSRSGSIGLIVPDGAQVVISIGQPVASPDPSIIGGTVSILIPIIMTSGVSGTQLKVVIEIQESATGGSPGDLLDTFEVTDSFALNITKNITVDWVTKGAIGSKDVTISVYQGTILLDGNNFDDALHVNPENTIPGTNFQLIEDSVSSYAEAYSGDAQRCIFTFSLGPEQIPGTNWVKDSFIGAFSSEIEKKGEHLLTVKVWEDATPTWTTNYKVEVTVTGNPDVVTTSGITPSVFAWWPVIIAAVIVIAIVAVITFAIIQVNNLWYGPSGGTGDGVAGFGSIISLILPMMMLMMMMEMMGKMMGSVEETPVTSAVVGGVKKLYSLGEKGVEYVREKFNKGEEEGVV